MSAATDAVAARAQHRSGPPYSVVAIDDQPDLLTLYRHMFRDGPFRLVGEALDGRAGVEVVQASAPHIVLLDLSMPNRDGLEALIDLRRSCPGARVVILSGFGRERMEPLAKELGALAYVEKGTPPHDLLQVLEEVAAREPVPFREPSDDFRRRIHELV